jgi:hypothetical protein
VNSPGLFLSPYQILFTKENGRARAALGLPANPDHPRVSLARLALVCFPGPSINRLDKATEKCPKPAAVRDGVKDRDVTQAEWVETLALVDYVGRFGAKNIPVIVDGIMTVAIDQVPAAIDDVSFDGDGATAAFWASGQHKVILQCRFCAGGQVTIQEAATLGIAEIKVLADESNEHKLTASFNGLRGRGRAGKGTEPGADGDIRFADKGDAVAHRRGEDRQLDGSHFRKRDGGRGEVETSWHLKTVVRIGKPIEEFPCPNPNWS